MRRLPTGLYRVRTTMHDAASAAGFKSHAVADSTRLVRIRDYNGTRGRTNMEEEFLPYFAIILPQQVQPIVRDVCADGHEFWVAWFDGRGKPISGL